MDNLLGAIRGSQPPPAASFAFPGAGRDGPLPTGSVGGFEGAKTGRPGDGGVSSRPAPAGAMADVKQSPGHPGRVIGVGAQAMDHGVRLLGAGTKEDGLDSEEEDEAAPLDIDDLLEEPLCEKVKGLGTFYILIDKHSRRRKRGFTGLRRSQKAAIVRQAYTVIENACEVFCPGERMELLDAITQIHPTYRRRFGRRLASTGIGSTTLNGSQQHGSMDSSFSEASFGSSGGSGMGGDEAPHVTPFIDMIREGRPSMYNVHILNNGVTKDEIITTYKRLCTNTGGNGGSGSSSSSSSSAPPPAPFISAGPAANPQLAAAAGFAPSFPLNGIAFNPAGGAAAAAAWQNAAAQLAAQHQHQPQQQQPQQQQPPQQMQGPMHPNSTFPFSLSSALSQLSHGMPPAQQPPQFPQGNAAPGPLAAPAPLAYAPPPAPTPPHAHAPTPAAAVAPPPPLAGGKMEELSKLAAGTLAKLKRKSDGSPVIGSRETGAGSSGGSGGSTPVGGGGTPVATPLMRPSGVPTPPPPPQQQQHQQQQHQQANMMLSAPMGMAPPTGNFFIQHQQQNQPPPSAMPGSSPYAPPPVQNAGSTPGLHEFLLQQFMGQQHQQPPPPQQQPQQLQPQQQQPQQQPPPQGPPPSPALGTLARPPASMGPPSLPQAPAQQQQHNAAALYQFYGGAPRPRTAF